MPWCSRSRGSGVKKVTAAGWSLPNILQHGGVCADQAYFAVTVGKSIGVPTAYTIGLGGEVGHAWVGFLQARGKRGRGVDVDASGELYDGTPLNGPHDLREALLKRSTSLIRTFPRITTYGHNC